MNDTDVEPDSVTDDDLPSGVRIGDEIAPCSLPPRVCAESLCGDETVLLVEDEEPVRNVVSKILRRAGYCVLTAIDVDDALRMGQQYPGTIDLLLTDVLMPKLNGRQLAEQFNALRPTTKILLMSGYTPDPALLKGTVSLVLQFIPKPLTADQLLSKVRSVLDA